MAVEYKTVVEGETPPVVETKVEPSAPEVKTEPVIEAKTEGEPEVKTPPAPEVKEPGWKDREIARLRAKLAANAGKPEGEIEIKPAGSLTEADVERRANERAEQLTAKRIFDQACNETVQAGRTAHPDFDSRLAGLKELVDPRDASQVQTYNDFLAAVLETGDQAAEIIYALGGDQDEAARIMTLPPVKLAAALAGLSNKAAPGGNLPKPIIPIGRKGPQNEEIDPADANRADKLSTATWMERRNAQVAASQKARGRA